MPIISIEIINYLHQFQGCLRVLATNPQRNTAQGHFQDVRFISIFYNRWHSIIDFVTKFPEPTPLEPISVNFTHMRLQVEDTKGFDTFHWLWPENLQHWGILQLNFLWKIIGNTFYFFLWYFGSLKLQFPKFLETKITKNFSSSTSQISSMLLDVISLGISLGRSG